MPDEMVPVTPAARGGPARLPDPASVPRPWLESYPPGVPRSYEYPRVPLTRLLDDAAQDLPEAVAIDYLGARTTYRELIDAADRLAASLAALGVRKGDRVALLLPNCPQHLVALFAVWRIGAVVTEHDAGAVPARLEHELNDSGARVVICTEDSYATLARLKGRLYSVGHVIVTGLAEVVPLRRRLRARASRRVRAARRIPESEGVLRLRELIERAAPLAAQARVDPARDLAALLYTGSRVAGGVMLTHRNLVSNAFQTRLWLPDVQAGREVVLAGAPLSHAFGLTACALQSVLSAATLVLLPRLEPRLVNRTTMRRKPTLLLGGPPLYEALAQASNPVREDLPWVRACLAGGGELSEPVARAVEKRTGGKLREGWGLTECAPVTHANPVYGKAKTGTVGLPVPDTVCLVVDAEHPTHAVEPGTSGELLVNGPQVMLGYWGRRDESAGVLVEGWMRTGTLARMDAEGYFTVVGRTGRHA